MVSMQASNHGRGSLTPGEIDSKLSTQLYLNASSKASAPTLGNQDYIAALKGSGVRSAYSAFSAEALQLPDADLRLNSKFEKVWGNAAFEEGSHGAPPIVLSKPGSVKLNNLFDEPSTRERQVDQHLSSGNLPNRLPSPGYRNSNNSEDALPGESARGPSIINFFKGSKSQRDMQPERIDVGNATLVRGFHEEDAPVVTARPTKASAPAVAPVVDKSVGSWEVEIKQMIASNMRDEAVHRAAPSVGMVRCYIKRVKGFFGSHCTFEMHLDNGDAFLLAARRRKKSKTSSYIISLDLEDLKRDTENCISKLKANFVGTEYMLWGKSENNSVKKGYASEDLCINYKGSSITSAGGPRSMHVMLPLPEVGWQPTAPDGSDSLSSSLELAKRRELPPFMERKVAVMCTKQPEYDESLKAYTLDFHGRVKEASVKNFQLVAWDHTTDRKGGDLLLQFGKIEDDIYALDFAYPFSIYSAFAVALASIDTKLCYAM